VPVDAPPAFPGGGWLSEAPEKAISSCLQEVCPGSHWLPLADSSLPLSQTSQPTREKSRQPVNDPTPELSSRTVTYEAVS